MATNSEKTQDLTIEEKLQNLYELQKIDSEIDKIKTLRGELPLEVQDLEDEIAGLETRIENYRSEIGELEKNISGREAGGVFLPHPGKLKYLLPDCN